MGRHCQVCTHAAIHRIDRELLGGAKLQPTALHYGVPLTSLHRHRTQCLGLSKAETAVSAPSRLAGIKADKSKGSFGNFCTSTLRLHSAAHLGEFCGSNGSGGNKRCGL